MKSTLAVVSAWLSSSFQSVSSVVYCVRRDAAVTAVRHGRERRLQAALLQAGGMVEETADSRHSREDCRLQALYRRLKTGDTLSIDDTAHCRDGRH